MLKTKCILHKEDNSDGLRISIMSRHTLNDGKTPDSRITIDRYNLWLKNFAPPEKLIGDYYKRGLSWENFEKEYLSYLRTERIEVQVRKLAQRSLDENITLLCIEESPERCHRRILAEECLRYEPKLILQIS